MTAFQRAIVGLAAVGLVVAAVLFRFEVVIGSRGDGLPPAYVLDRWTGAVRFVLAGQARELVPAQSPASP